MKIKVKQEHIDLGVGGNAQYCPVSRAILEQVKNARVVWVSRDDVTVLFKDGKKRQWKNDWTVWERITLFDVEKRMVPFEFELENL